MNDKSFKKDIKTGAVLRIGGFDEIDQYKKLKSNYITRKSELNTINTSLLNIMNILEKIENKLQDLQNKLDKMDNCNSD